MRLSAHARHYRIAPPGDRPRKAPSAASGLRPVVTGRCASDHPPDEHRRAANHRLVGAGRRLSQAVGSTEPRVANDAHRDTARTLPRSELRALRALSAKGSDLPRTYRGIQEFTTVKTSHARSRKRRRGRGMSWQSPITRAHGHRLRRRRNSAGIPVPVRGDPDNPGKFAITSEGAVQPTVSPLSRGPGAVSVSDPGCMMGRQ